MNNLYSLQTKVITKRTPSLFSMVLKALGILLFFMGWSIGSIQAKTWYAINNVKTGELEGWQNPINWTEDPAAALWINSGNEIPGDEDDVIIKSGKEMSMPAGKKVTTTGTVTVDGNLFVNGTDVHDFGTLKGSGRIYLKGSNFPASTVNSTHFISEFQGAGTVVFRHNQNITLTQPLLFFNVEIEMSETSSVLLQNNLLLNGGLTVKSGTLRFNDTTKKLLLQVKKNMVVNSSGRIEVMNSNSNFYHDLEVWGNLENYGTLKMSNAAQYAAATNGAVRLIFKGATDNSFLVNGSTELYRLFLDKGVGSYYTLSVTSNNPSYFKLMGPVEGNTGLEPDALTTNPGWKNLALVLTNGTLKLGANINIPRLGKDRSGNAQPYEFHIPKNAALWVAGATVSTDETGGGWAGITVFGKLKVSAGTFENPSNSGGVTYFGNSTEPGSLEITGGEVKTTQLKSAQGGGQFNYIQTGGELLIDGVLNGDESAVFALPYADHTFTMSGGKISISNLSTQPINGIHIGVKEGNFNVTGGTIEIKAGTTGTPFKVSSTASLYDVSILETGSRVELHNDLQVLNDLTVGTGTQLNSNDKTLSVGKDLIVSGTLNTNYKTLVFNGSIDSRLHNYTGDFLSIGNLEVNKTSVIRKLTLVRGVFRFDGNLTLTQGNFDLGAKTVDTKGSVSLFNGSVVANTTIGLRLVGTTNSSSLYSDSDSNSFGWVEATNAGAITVTSNIRFKKFTLTSGVFNIGDHKMIVDETQIIGTGFSATKMIRTSGNSSAKGLEYRYSSLVPGEYIYPIGANNGSNRYTPLKVTVHNTKAISGTLAAYAVPEAHPSARDAFLSSVLPYYWMTKTTGFNSILDEDISLEFEYYRQVSSWYLTNLFYRKNQGVWTTDGERHSSFESLLFSKIGTKLEGDFTSSEVDYLLNIDAFQNTKTLYSRQTGNWNSVNTWSTIALGGAASGSTPTAQDIVVIGNNHVVHIENNNRAAAQIEIKEGATLDIRSHTGHNFTDIKGGGKFRTSTATLPNADFGDFVTNETAIFEYYGTGALTIPNTLRTYPNLLITGTGAKTSPSVNLKVRSLTLDDSGGLRLSNNANGNITVEKDVKVSSGTLLFQGATPRLLTILGDLSVTEGNITANGSVNHNIHLYGDLNQTGGILAFKGTNSSNITLSLLGNNTVEVKTVSATNSDLYRVIVNKPSNMIVAFNNGFSLSAPTNGDVKSLVLQSGIAQLNSSAINLTLSSGGADFKIPSVAALQVFEGSKVTVSGTGTGIWLDGSLEIDYGTSANRSSVLCDVGSNNYIEFTSSGKSSITVGDYATLQVGSQIRRNSVSEEGALTFLQTKANSIVKIGTKNSLPVNHRGVFEMMGAGSSFKQLESDSKIEILNSQDSGTFPALFFNPANVEIAANSRFIIGGTSTPPDKVIDIYAGKPIRGLTVAGDKKARLVIGNLTLLGDLDIQSGAELLTSNLDLSIHGNFNSSGTYSPGFNTTSFVGTGNQAITGNPTFYNLTKKGGTGSLTISNGSSAIVSHNLSLEKGLIESGASTLQVKGNAHVETETFLSSLTMNGAELQLLSGGGVMGKLIVNNTHGVSVPSQTAPITVKDKLSLKAGVLNIGQNLLDLLKEAEITGIDDGIGEAAFSTANMIQTFVSFTDAGVRKWFPSISSPYAFIYPVGSEAKYTPVTMNITGITSTNGSIRVKAANERHVSITDRIETPFNDMNNVLQYYWTMDAEGIKGFKAEVRMKTYPEDVKVDALGKTAADYITARILANSDKWVPGTVEGFDEENSVLIFNDVFTGTDDLGIDGDYTAGLPDAVPERIPAYISVVENGNWNDASTWATYNPQTKVTGSPGVGVQQGGPVGNIVYINKSIGLGDHNRRAFRTHIMADATLDIGSFVNNRLGNVDGTGRLKVETGTLPAGFYDDFVKSTGGTIQYSGSTDYTVMGESTVFNNVEFTGTGNRILPSINISLNGKLVVNGPKTVINKNLTIAGDLIFNGGEISSAIGSKIILSGTQPQLVGGTKTFTGDNAFQNVTFNNSNKVTLNTNVEVKKNVELVRGMVYTSSSGLLTILDASTDALSGTTPSRYIEGPLVRQIDGTTNRVMPIGKSGRYGEITLWDDGGGGLWRAEYFNAGPADRSQVTDPIKYVSANEYWQVQSPTLSHSGKVTLRWDAKSGVNHEDINFKVVSSTSSANWKEIGFTNKVGTISAGTLRTVAHSFQKNDRFTFGSSNIADFTWLGAISSDWFTKENWSNSIVPSAANNVIIDYAGSTWPVIKGENVAHTNDLTISSGKKLEVGSGGKLTVEGDLVVEKPGGLVLESKLGPNGLASLITKGEVIGEAEVKLQIEGDPERYYYLSSAVETPTYKELGVISSPFEGFRLDVYRKAQWITIHPKYNSSQLRSMEGFMVNNSTDGLINIDLTGNLNSGEIVRSFAESGWHLFGNPYPSAINWASSEAAGLKRENISPTIWYRTQIGTEMAFVTYNGATNTASYSPADVNDSYTKGDDFSIIPPYQSVWIKAANLNGSITLNNGARLHSYSESYSAPQLKSSMVKESPNKIRILASNQYSRDATVLSFGGDYSVEFGSEDSEKYFNSSERIPEVFTKVGTRSIAINGLPELITYEEDFSIPISVRNRDDSPVTLKFNLDEFSSNHSLALVDNETGDSLSITNGFAYTYTPSHIGENHDRFVLRFNSSTQEEDVSTSILDELVNQKSSQINIVGANGRAIVSIGRELLAKGPGKIEVYSVDGIKLSESEARTHKTFLVLPEPAGVYVVVVTASGERKVKKLLR